MTDTVTFVVQHRVHPEAFERYEAWLKKVMAVSSTYPGYQSVDVIRPTAGHNEYAAVVRFASFADAYRWCRSADRVRLLAEIEDILEDAQDRPRIHHGIDFWFSPPHASARQAPRWKQWLVTTALIWPLSLIVPVVLRPLSALPGFGDLFALPAVRQAAIVAAIVALVVFVLMPPTLKVLARWLYRPARERR